MKKKLLVTILLISFFIFTACSKEESIEVYKNYNLKKVEISPISLTNSYISYAE
jgi:thioredoxin-related protein